jgi:hypothetical protein
LNVPAKIADAHLMLQKPLLAQEARVAKELLHPWNLQRGMGGLFVQQQQLQHLQGCQQHRKIDLGRCLQQALLLCAAMTWHLNGHLAEAAAAAAVAVAAAAAVY